MADVLVGLHMDVTKEELHKFLSGYGTITEIKLLPHYAFVQFESVEDARIVLDTYQRQPLLGNRVTIEYSRALKKSMPSIQSSNSSENRPQARYRHPVIVTGIPAGICWQELKDFGRSSGQLVAFCDLDKCDRGRGFIEYFSREDARRAARVLNGRRLGGRSVAVVDHEETESRLRRRIWGNSRYHGLPQHGLGRPDEESSRDNAENIQRWGRYSRPRTPEQPRYDYLERWNRGASYPSHDTYDCRGVGELYGEKSPSFDRIIDWANDCGGGDEYRFQTWVGGLYNQDFPHPRVTRGTADRDQTFERAFEPYH